MKSHRLAGSLQTRREPVARGEPPALSPLPDQVPGRERPDGGEKVIMIDAAERPSALLRVRLTWSQRCECERRPGKCGRKAWQYWAKGLASTTASACYNPDMAAIVGVHGIAQQFRGGYQLGTVWYDALRDGLAAAGYRSAADALAPADVRVAFFGDLFRPPGAMAARDPPYLGRGCSAGPGAGPAGGALPGSCGAGSLAGRARGGDGPGQGRCPGHAGPAAAVRGRSPGARSGRSDRQPEAGHPVPGRRPVKELVLARVRRAGRTTAPGW